MQFTLKLILACIILAIPTSAAFSADAPTPYPFWDGKESVASYAKRVNLPPTKTIDLGKGVRMELVLIPAGKFLMGTPEPQPPEINRFESEILMWLGIALSIGFLSMLVVRKLQKKKVAFSMRYLLVITTGAGMAGGGYARARFADQEWARYDEEFKFYENASATEKPARSVTLTLPFYMGKYTVTQAQYEAVVGVNPSTFSGAQLPVEWVSFRDAEEFCRKLDGLHGHLVFEAHLPTDAQWEFACRAGTTTHYHSGNHEADLNAVGWYGNNSIDKIHPVGQKKPNNFGLYDMHGNVWQWCTVVDSERGSVLNTTSIETAGRISVLRGGSWGSPFLACRSACRSFHFGSLDYRLNNVGFRVAVPLPSNSNP